MDFRTYNFRNAIAILNARPEWNDLLEVVRSIKRGDIIAEQQRLTADRKKPPKGAQTATNQIFKDRLTTLKWQHEVRLLNPDNSLGGH